MVYTSTINNNLNFSEKVNNKKRKLTIGRSSFKLSYSFLDRRISRRETEPQIQLEDRANVTELAAIILCRTQLKRGQPEEALRLLQKFIENHGTTQLVAIEVLKIENLLNKETQPTVD